MVETRSSASRCSFPPCLDGRGVRLTHVELARVHRDDAVRTEFAVLCEQGELRSPRTCVWAHLWLAVYCQQLLEQLWPVSVSREADSIDADPRARRQTAARVRQGRECARLVVRRRSLPRDRRDL